MIARVQASGAALLEVAGHHLPKSPFQPLSVCLPRLLALRTAHCRSHLPRCAYSCMCNSAWQLPSVWAAYPSGPSTSPNFLFYHLRNSSSSDASTDLVYVACIDSIGTFYLSFGSIKVLIFILVAFLQF